MPGNHKKLLLLFIVFLINGLTYGQIPKDLLCGQVCLSTQVTCTCALTGPNLIWRVRNMTGHSIGEEILLPGNLNNPVTLFEGGDFEAVITNSSNGALTATLTFITLSDYEGYTIECDIDGYPEGFTIAIPGPPSSVSELQLAGFTFGLVMLIITPPTNSPCIANYNITTDANALPPTTVTNVTISRPANNAQNATYSVSVAAVDFAGRMGPLTSLDCFIFSGPNAMIFIDGVMYESQDGVCAAMVQWTVEANDCLPAITSYIVTVDSTEETIAEGSVTPTRVFHINNVTIGEVYNVTIAPSNTLGIGSPTSTNFMVPTDCPVALRDVTESTTSTPGSAESGSTTLLFSNSGGIAVLAAIIAFVVSGIQI